MKYSNITLIITIFLLVCTTGCTNAQQNSPFTNAKVDHDQFGTYWYQGKAELNHFKIEEIRYGEIRKGNAVMVFVTEDFLTKKQVKLETPPKGRDHVTVLKLNYIEEFTTGIYEYNMMGSIFSPVKVYKYPFPQKITISSQDWCGHSFFQLNETPKGFDLKGFSYFESEGDFTGTLPKVLLEDDIWNKIRLNPDLLPTGNVRVMPGGFYQRFSHRDWAPVDAEIKRYAFENRDQTFPGNNLMAYQINYPELERTLTIIYEKKAPHKIAGWIKKRKGAQGEVLTATSVRTDLVKSAYWKQNGNKDLNMRDSLGISRKNLHVDE